MRRLLAHSPQVCRRFLVSKWSDKCGNKPNGRLKALILSSDGHTACEANWFMDLLRNRFLIVIYYGKAIHHINKRYDIQNHQCASLYVNHSFYFQLYLHLTYKERKGIRRRKGFGNCVIKHHINVMGKEFTVECGRLEAGIRSCRRCSWVWWLDRLGLSTRSFPWRLILRHLIRGC